ncbi:hypothetical protein [Aurantimonas endophytica]|uniref:Uncharacterized protein n=1 Tax=Aurantimonas endophytica TaxID=1522175 RepID=A0A7W6HI68_9HYPH|nr:hypothetical protein [Aurantimonas endophytica]MBB4005664.1 hypothetical protein [Aurantimonas endophytica]MCO6406386.1 hypothetical protein [Aurantimonas endophytica]
MDFLDTYSLKARLFPAVLAVAPAVVLCLLCASWVDPGLPEAVATVAVMVLFFAAANLARRFGRAKEEVIFADTGGKPRNRELTHADRTLPASQKERYRSYLAVQLGLKPPTAEDEKNHPDEAQAFYDQAYGWLRENTRDTQAFRLLFTENIAYGYYRNLLGLKSVGITLNFLSLAAAAAIVYWQAEFAALSEGKLVLLGILSLLHLLYFIFGVRRKAMLDASHIYARQLVLSLETLMRRA